MVYKLYQGLATHLLDGLQKNQAEHTDGQQSGDERNYKFFHEILRMMGFNLDILAMDSR